MDMRTDEAKLIDFGLASEVQHEPFTKFRGENHGGKILYATFVTSLFRYKLNDIPYPRQGGIEPRYK